MLVILTPTLRRALGALASLLLALGCASPRGASARQAELPLPELECTCGEVESDVLGCLAAACARERGDASNPACACVPLDAGRLWLADGSSVEGTVLQDDGLTLELRTADGGTRTLEHAQLAPRTAYRAACARTTRTDALAQLELAELARELGLLARARQHLAWAEAAAPSSAAHVALERAELEDASAVRLLSAAEEAQAAGRAREAERLYSAVLTLHPTSVQAAAAASALSATESLARAARASREEAWTEETAGALAEPAAELALLHDYSWRGLMIGSAPIRAIAHFEAALARGDRARARLAELRASATEGSELASCAGELEREAQEQGVSTCARLAAVSGRVGAHETARQAALRARALAPGSADARRLHARVALSAERAARSP